jgi:hypothetical protein
MRAPFTVGANGPFTVGANGAHHRRAVCISRDLSAIGKKIVVRFEELAIRKIMINVGSNPSVQEIISPERGRLGKSCATH